MDFGLTRAHDVMNSTSNVRKDIFKPDVGFSKHRDRRRKCRLYSRLQNCATFNVSRVTGHCLSQDPPLASMVLKIILDCDVQIFI